MNNLLVSRWGGIKTRIGVRDINRHVHVTAMHLSMCTMTKICHNDKSRVASMLKGLLPRANSEYTPYFYTLTKENGLNTHPFYSIYKGKINIANYYSNTRLSRHHLLVKPRGNAVHVKPDRVIS